MYGISLILTLAFVGGLIAYIGDKIGMKVGRKRLTLFGLRPKHTGIIITIFTGIFIAVASIILLSIASNDVRTALFRMKSIQEALVTSRQELDESMIRVREMEEGLGRMISERDSAAAELQQVQGEMEKVRVEYEIVASDLERARQEVQVERVRVDEFREISQRLQTRVEELDARRVDLENGVLFLVGQYEELVDEYFKLHNKMRYGDLAFRAHEIILAQVFESGDSLAQVNTKLLDFLREADRRALNRGARVDEEQGMSLRLPQQAFDMAVQTLHQEKDLYVVRAVSKNNTVVGEPLDIYLELITNELLFLKGSVLAEGTFDLNDTPEIDKHILTILGRANDVASTRGMITVDGAAVVVSGEAFLGAIAQAKELSGEVLVQAVAAEDTWTAVGPLKLELKVTSK